MKKIKLLAAVTALAVILSCVGCSTPNSDDNSGGTGSSSSGTDLGSGGAGSGGGTGAGGGAGTGGGTEAGSGGGVGAGGGTEAGSGGGTEAGSGGETGTGGGTGAGSTEPPTSQYKWLLTHWETESQSNSSSYTSTSNSTMNYAYSFYNSDFDYGFTTIYELNMNVTSNGNTTNTSSNTKTVTTCSQTGNNITIHSNNYTMNGSSWVLSSESSSVYYKYTQLLSSNNTRTYPAGTETTTNYTVELLDNSNGVERYKVIYPAEYGIYYVDEFANNRIQKQICYNSGTNKKVSEVDYIYSDNSTLVENNIELALTQTKTYDNNEQIISQSNTTLGNVTLNANNTITVVLGNSTNTATNYSYTTEIFTKMQVPYSQQ